MPRVTMRTGFIGADGQDEELSEFVCDAPGCPNIATDVLGCVTDAAARQRLRAGPHRRRAADLRHRLRPDARSRGVDPEVPRLLGAPARRAGDRGRARSAGPRQDFPQAPLTARPASGGRVAVILQRRRPVVQCNTTVNGTDAVGPTGATSRSRLPSAATSPTTEPGGV
jgi:hypothetical protein